MEDEPGVAAAGSRGGSLSKASAIPPGRGPVSAQEAEGEQHYEFPDGGEYYGEWQKGMAKGRGIYVWPSGGCTLTLDMLCYSIFCCIKLRP